MNRSAFSSLVETAQRVAEGEDKSIIKQGIEIYSFLVHLIFEACHANWLKVKSQNLSTTTKTKVRGNVSGDG
jgi:hypothetical protein